MKKAILATILSIFVLSTQKSQAFDINAESIREVIAHSVGMTGAEIITSKLDESNAMEKGINYIKTLVQKIDFKKLFSKENMCKVSKVKSNILGYAFGLMTYKAISDSFDEFITSAKTLVPIKEFPNEKNNPEYNRKILALQIIKYLAASTGGVITAKLVALTSHYLLSPSFDLNLLNINPC